MLTLALLASAVVPPPPPPVVDDRPPGSATATIVEYRPGAVRCGGRTVTPRFTTDPLPTAAMLLAGGGVPSFTLNFRIDADGRPTAISNPERQEGATGYLNQDDLAPSLAAWRFAKGAAQEGCSVTFAPQAMPIATAPIAAIYRFVALPRLSQLGWAEAYKRATQTGGNCSTPRPPTRLLAGMPDFRRIPQPPATMSWTMIAFDVDSAGKPVRTRVLASDGNRALDGASVDAIDKSRFAAGEPRTGCNYPFHRRQNVALAAPDALASYPKPTNERCTMDAKVPTVLFPNEFRRRAIEGWGSSSMTSPRGARPGM